jgi:hypothetical protein
MKEGMQRLRFMQGEWDVDAHLMGESGEWVATPIPTETTIKPLIGGACHHEIMPVFFDGETVRLLFSWSYDQFRSQYRMISCDESSGLMSIMEGNFIPGTDTVVVSDFRPGAIGVEADRQPAYFQQLASTKTSQNSFTDIVSESYDNGANWQPVFRAVHTRKKVFN